jgi:hypothetical protein
MESPKAVEPRKEPTHGMDLLSPRPRRGPQERDEAHGARPGDRDSCEASLWSEWSVARRYVSSTGGR